MKKGPRLIERPLGPIKRAIDHKRVYSVREAAKIFGIHHFTFLKFIHQGSIAAIRANGLRWGHGGVSTIKRKKGSILIMGESLLSFLNNIQCAPRSKQREISLTGRTPRSKKMPPRLFQRNLSSVLIQFDPMKVYTAGEVGQIVNVSDSTVLKWIHQGHFPTAWKEGKNKMMGDSIISFLKQGRLRYLLNKRAKRKLLKKRRSYAR